MTDKKGKKKTSKHKRVTEDGRVWYYYPKKKKLGRKKKRGPKKKKKESWVRRVFEPWLFRIILCGNKQQIKYISRHHNELEVSEKKESLLKKNDEVLIPVELKNNPNETKMIEWDLEYIVLKKKDEETDTSGITKLPNKFGKYVDHVVNSDEWIIWDKFPCKIEESFWVYGYDSISDKKDVIWIYENLIDSKIECSYDILRICLYNNKLIIQDDNKQIDIVICKNKHDGIRLYNCLRERFCIKNKNTIFTGLVRRGSEKQKEIISLIKNKTNWQLKDIYRSSTRH